MAGLCDLVKQGAQGIQSAAGSGVVQNLINVANAFAAADVAIRIGSGGEVGVLDLPRLLDTKGIPCYSPELGDIVYVTPMQWYANGMKCEGLRDFDREAIKKRVDKIEQLQRIKKEIKKKGLDIPSDFLNQLEPDGLSKLEKIIKDIPDDALPSNGFGNGAGAEFLVGGTLIQTLTAESFPVTALGVTTFTTNYSNPPGKYYHKINPGDKLSVRNSTGRGSVQRVVFESYVTITNSSGQSRDLSRTVRIYANGREIVPYFLAENYQFVPQTSPPGQTISIDPPSISPPTLKEPPEGPCDMGCSCGDIANLLREARKTNNNLDRLIREIHFAVSAGSFIAPLPYQPEATIESLGKRMYGVQGSSGKGGVIQARNLLEAIASLVAANYHRSGLQKFPAKVPTTLIPNPSAKVEAIDKDETELQDLASFLKWTFEQQNAALGQFPIEFDKIDDNKTTRVQIWNVEHALAELLGSTWKIQEDADLAVQWGVRGATEASKAGNAALKALHATLQLIKATGLVTDKGLEEVSCTFNPDPLAQKLQTPEQMLTPTKQQIDVVNISDARTIMQLLLNINYWCQKAGLAVTGDLSINPATKKPNLPGDQIKEDKKKSKADDKAWDEWLKLQKNPKPISKENLPPDHQQAEIKDIKP